MSADSTSDTTDEEAYLRTGLVQALRKEHCGRLCRGEPSDTSHTASLLSQSLVWSMVASQLFWLMIDVDIDFWQAGGIVGLFLFALAGFAALTKRFGAAALVIAAAWVATGVLSFLEGGAASLLLTHLVPFAIVPLGASMWRAVSLAGAVPFLLPIALLVVFLPLLSQDLWTVGDEIGWQLIGLAAVALGPLLVILGVRFARVDVVAAFRESAGRFPDPDDDFRDRVLEAVKEAPRSHAVAEPPSDDWLWARLEPLYRDGDLAARAAEIGGEVRPQFRRQTLLRLSRFVVGTVAFFAGFIYLLAWAAIPLSTSSVWVGHPIATETIRFAGLEAAVPTFPYISVALVLAIVAAAAFIAFALTEDRYSTALSEVLVGRPAERCLTLALPYRALPATDA
jgi:MFS family permease